MRLERVHEALRVLSAPVFHQDGNALPLRDSAIERFNEFSTHYHERAIWLEKATCDRMNVLVGLLKKLLTELDYNLTPGGAIQDRTR